MKKIMFNDKYGLTKAVLEGRKTQTRRIIKDVDLLQCLNELEEAGELKCIKGDIVAQGNARYKVGEIVAIAQAYKDCKRFVCLQESAGFNNKMFVKAELMPHHIRITDVRVERLQDISTKDCIAEGICKVDFYLKERGLYSFRFENEWYKQYQTPKEAYSTLIDKISGKGTWDTNPYVFVYEFELVDSMKREKQLSESFIKMLVEESRQEYKEYHANNPNADKETIFTVGYCIGGFASVVFIMNAIEGFIGLADEEIRKSAGIEKQRNLAQKKTFEDMYRVLENITKGYTEEIKEDNK